MGAGARHRLKKTAKRRAFEQLKLITRQPRSNVHGRKRPFTEKNGDIRRSYTVFVHGHRIRSETVRNGFRIRRSYKNTE